MNMEFKQKDIKQHSIKRYLPDCKTVVHRPVVMVLAIILGFGGVSCSPSGDTTNLFNTYGSDKKLPDDDGYSGGGGTGDGGGGQGVLCSEGVSSPKFKSKLFVRDLFEEEYTSNNEIVKLDQKISSSFLGVSDEAFKLLMRQLGGYFGPAMTKMEFGTEEFWRSFVKRIAFIEDSAKLRVSRDANSPIVLPNGCKIVQIAFWSDSIGREQGGTLYVDKKHWDQLDQVNKIALLIHEYFFKEARTAGFKNSDFVRAKVGQLFLSTVSTPLFSKWRPSASRLVSHLLPNRKTGFKYCVGLSDQDPKAKVILYQYEGSDGNPYFVIPYLKSNLFAKSSLLRSEYRVANIEPWVRDLLYLNSSFQMMVRAGEISPQNKYLDMFMFKGGAEGLDAYDSSKKWNGIKSGTLIWQNQVEQEAGNAAKITIELPELIKDERDVVANKEELARKIYVQLSATIRDIAKQKGVSISYEDENYQVIKALIVLRKEISEFLADGLVPRGLPKWKDALKEIEKEYLKSVELINDEEKFKSGDLTSNDTIDSLLDLIVKVEIGLTDNFESVHQRLLDATLTRTVPARNPVLSLEKNAEKIQFSLDCENFNEVYWSAAQSESINGRMKVWKEPDFDLSKFRPIDDNTQDQCKTILKHIVQKTKLDFENQESDFVCEGEEKFAECNGSDLKDLLTREHLSKPIEVTGCESQDLEAAESVSANNTGRDNFLTTLSCLVLKVGDHRYFQIFAEVGSSETDVTAKSINIAPRESYVEKAESDL